VWAWGSNGYGQLGDGTTTNRYYATAVSGLDGTLDAVEVAAGQNFSLALMADGTLRAWGVNDLGQLGNGTKTNSSAPVHVLASAGVDLARVRHISAGQYHGLALVGSSDTDLSDPALWTARSWGGNYSAQLGDYTTVEKTYPVQVKTGSSAYLTGIKKVAGGGGHTLFLLTDGTVWTAGRNWDGIRGTGGDPVFSDMAPGSYAVKASVIDGSSLAAADIAAGSSHSAALMSDGTVYAWGSNDYGQVGDGSTSMLLLPVARGAL
jgi:alpha-tubulin suppressor-like RCC1 family protein